MGRRLIHPRRSSGFSLLEMIAVMAIIGILAAAVVPATLRMIEDAAQRAEASQLSAFGAHLEAAVRVSGTLPAVGTTTVNGRTVPRWVAAIQDYADASIDDIMTLRRSRVDRVYIPDATTQRAILISSGKAGLTLPPATAFNATRFQQLWDTPTNGFPDWNGWWSGGAAWTTGTAEDRNYRRDYLTIQRVSLRTALEASAPRTISLNNAGTVAARYRIVPVSGTAPSLTNLPAPPAVASHTVTLALGEELQLYDQSGMNPIYRYRLSEVAPPQFEFDGVRWRAR